MKCTVTVTTEQEATVTVDVPTDALPHQIQEAALARVKRSDWVTELGAYSWVFSDGRFGGVAS